MNIWQRRFYWQAPGQMEGFTSLPETLDTNCITGNQRIIVAKELLRLFCMLHTQNIIQNDLKAEDVFVTEPHEVTCIETIFWVICMICVYQRGKCTFNSRIYHTSPPFNSRSQKYQCFLSKILFVKILYIIYDIYIDIQKAASVCLVVSPIMIDDYALFFDCTAVRWARTQ